MGDSTNVRYRQNPFNKQTTFADTGDQNRNTDGGDQVGFYDKPFPSEMSEAEPSSVPYTAIETGFGGDAGLEPRKQKRARKDRNLGGRIFLAIFATRQLAGKGDRELYISYLIRELLIYLVYLIVLCLLTFGMTNATTYYFTRVIHDLIIDKPFEDSGNTFKTSTDVIDFWDFQNDVLKNLYWYERSGVRRYVTDVNHSKGLFYENELMGVPRLRQLRVKGKPCPATDFKYSFIAKECFPSYSEEDEDKGHTVTHSWAKSPIPKLAKNGWIYKSEDQLRGSSHWGRLARYSGAGAVQNLEKTYLGSDQITNLLKQNLWITSATRAVFLDFTFYNSNINLFCIARLLWEFSPTGATTTSWNLRTVKLIRYVSTFDKYVVFPCEIIFCLFTFYYLIQEIVEMVSLGCREYWKDIWSWLDLGILAISIICIAFSIHRYQVVQEKLDTMKLDEDAFIDFEYLGFWQTQFNHTVSIAVFLSWVKIFKYISFNKTMTQLSSTLSRCAKDIGGFAIMFFIVFFAFAQLAYLLFGSQVEDFSTFEDSIFTLLRLILGDFDYEQLEDANRVLGPIFFIVYVFFVFFVLLNMFLAIINDTYGEVKAEIQAQRNEFEISDYFRRLFNNVAGVFGKKDPQIEAENRIKISDGTEEQITYDELRRCLLEAHYSEVEVEMFLARYELDQDRALDEEETQQVLADLEGKKIVLDRFADKESSGEILDEDAIAEQERLYIEEFTDLQNRVAMMETCIIDMQRKLDEAITKI